MARDVHVTGVERHFDDDEIIVSKTDVKGRLTYCNDVFLRIAHYTEQECLGQPHSMIRHPEMPRCVFKLLWDTIGDGKEIYAYVMNRCKNGDHYWVLAHVTPSLDASGKVTGYHSSRRVPDRGILEETVMPLYKDLLAEERRGGDRKAGLEASTGKLLALLDERGMAYDEFVATL